MYVEVQKIIVLTKTKKVKINDLKLAIIKKIISFYAFKS